MMADCKDWKRQNQGTAQNRGFRDNFLNPDKKEITANDMNRVTTEKTTEERKVRTQNGRQTGKQEERN